MLISNKNSFGKALARFKITCLVLCILFILLVFFELILRGGGFLYLSLQERKNSIALEKKSQYRIVCLGESMTAWGGSFSYPAQLEDILNTQGAGEKFSVINKGIPGASSAVVVNKLKESISRYHPDIVVVMMGINDQLYYSDTDVSAPGLVRFCRSLRLYKFAKLFYLNVEEIFLSKERRLIKQGCALRYNREYDQGERVFKQAILINSKSVSAYKNLGLLLEDKENFALAEDAFKSAIFISPTDAETYVYLGWLFEIQGRLPDAERAYKQAIEIDPKNKNAYENLGCLYVKQGDYVSAEQVFGELIKAKPHLDLGYAFLARVFAETGRSYEAEKLEAVAQRLRSENTISGTLDNYRKLLSIVLQNKSVPVFVQYPLRNVALLKEMFPDSQSVVFVDNQLVYRNALMHRSYSDLFTDMFAGDFGHCTPEGNRILAENIAKAILNCLPEKKEAF